MHNRDWWPCNWEKTYLPPAPLAFMGVNPAWRHLFGYAPLSPVIAYFVFGEGTVQISTPLRHEGFSARLLIMWPVRSNCNSCYDSYTRAPTSTPVQQWTVYNMKWSITDMLRQKVLLNLFDTRECCQKNRQKGFYVRNLRYISPNRLKCPFP